MPQIPDYELLHRIGQGSYGDVWLARGVTGLLRAVKIVWRDRFTEAAPFEREFRGLTEFAAISLGESIQLALLHVGRNDAAGFFYYVMELADDAHHGRTFTPADYVPLTLGELRRRRGRIPAADCLSFGVELARVLASLHRRGLVHRDIKPSNIILVEGVPKLADIGLVAPVTQARTFIGTEGFVPPEGPGSPAADVFALGKVLYELSTGRDQREFPQLPGRVAQLPDARLLLRLNDIILRACDPDPGQRYPDGHALLAALSELAATPSRRIRRGWRTQVIVGLLLALGLIASLWLRPLRLTPASTPARSDSRNLAPAANSAITAKSLAVLPFVNLSPDPANVFVADGLHEDVLNRLNLIADLRVVSRTSVMRYRDSSKSVEQIARELGVAYLLEGTVRRAGTKLRVSSRLIDGATGQLIWTQTHERDFTDVFALQAELAAAIAEALSAVIRPEANALLQQRPTENIAAYEQFIQARDAINRGELDQAAQLLESALRIDPAFVAAWCELVLVHSQAIFHFIDTSPARRAQVDAAMQRARALAPESPDVIRALGIYHAYGRRDYPQAHEQFERLKKLNPNDASVYHWLSIIDWRENRPAGAMVNGRQAIALDPANPRYSADHQRRLYCLRRWPELLAEQRRIALLWPGILADGDPRLAGPLGDGVLLAMTESTIAGNLRPLEQWVAQCPATEADASPALYARAELARLRGDLPEFQQFARRLAPRVKVPDFGYTILHVTDCLGAGDRAGGMALLRPLPQELRESLARDPTNAWNWLHLGRVEAMLGNTAASKAALLRSIELIPEKMDPVTGPLYSRSMAVTYAWFGDLDYAIAELTRLMSVPGAHLSGVELRTMATFTPLRGHPRFEALAHDPRNDEPLW